MRLLSLSTSCRATKALNTELLETSPPAAQHPLGRLAIAPTVEGPLQYAVHVKDLVSLVVLTNLLQTVSFPLACPHELDEFRVVLIYYACIPKLG